MSFSGLHSFIAGGEPYAPTRAKLLTWFQQRRDQPVPPTPDELQAAIGIIAQYLRRDPTRSVSEHEFQRVVKQIRAESDSPDESD